SLSFLVVQGSYGIGNGFLFPAGPLREPFNEALARADAVVLIGEDKTGIIKTCKDKPIFKATLQAVGKAPSTQQHYVAFAGIAHPSRFFETLKSNGYRCVKEVA